VLGDANTIEQLREYAAGPGVRINYFEALSRIRVRNVVQPGLGPKPVDFIAARTKDGGVYLYGDESHGALIQSRVEGGQLWLRYRPVCDFELAAAPWGPGYPLQLFEDPELRVEGDRAAWLSEWHSEREWLEAAHRTRYSNAVIGLQEYFAPWEPVAVPAVFRVAEERDWPLLRRFAERRRRVTQPDLLVLASDHWNFNVRGFNPGGNHGSFFRISTHSVFMAAGGGVPVGLQVEEPYDSLSFAPTVMALMGTLPLRPYAGPVIGEIVGKH
jgi:hypothetical protein